MIIFYIAVGLLAFGVLFWQLNLLFVAIVGTPTVYANNKAIYDAYKLAGLKRGELVVDLGCGNAKSLIIASRDFGAKGVGVDLSLYCYFKSRLNVALAGQSKNIKIIWGDFKAAELYLKKADVVYLYLLNSVLKKIEPWLFESVKKQTRIISLSFVFLGHKPIRSIVTTNLNKSTKVRLY